MISEPLAGLPIVEPKLCMDLSPLSAHVSAVVYYMSSAPGLLLIGHALQSDIKS